jgi:hypothetical protein
MSYERFSQLWDALVADRPNSTNALSIEDGMSEKTFSALVDYANGDKTKIESVRNFLGRSL